MSDDQRWFESDEDYRTRVTREADESTIERSTGIAPSRGWFEDDAAYQDRIAREANERRVEDSTGTSPSRGWFEGEAAYRDRIAREANEREIVDRGGPTPSQRFFESAEDYDIRVRKDANERLLESASGAVPKQGWFESEHEYRSRIAHEARLVRARAASTTSAGSIDEGSHGSLQSNGSGSPEPTPTVGRPWPNAPRSRSARRARPGLVLLFLCVFASAAVFLTVTGAGRRFVSSWLPGASVFGSASVPPPPADPVCDGATDVSLSVYGDLEKVIAMRPDCWSGWVRFPEGEYSWRINAPGQRYRVNYPDGRSFEIADKDDARSLAPTSSLRLRGKGRAVVAMTPSEVARIRNGPNAFRASGQTIPIGRCETAFRNPFSFSAKGKMVLTFALMDDGWLSATVEMEGITGIHGRLFEVRRDESGSVFRNISNQCGSPFLRISTTGETRARLAWGCDLEADRHDWTTDGTFFPLALSARTPSDGL